ncbi:MAG: hypothetical protein KKB31_04290 [Nanoarchaeota archaeon]|nr:hypothetical protein [Nanoarchaeota archaeon]
MGNDKTQKPRKPDNRKYDRKRVVALSQHGITPSLIAKDQNVAVSTITRYLQRVGEKYEKLQLFSKEKINCLLDSQLKSHTIEDMIKENWINNPGMVLTQDAEVQNKIIHTLQGGRKYDYDSQRLAEGRSTANIDVHLERADLKVVVAERRRVKAELKSLGIDPDNPDRVTIVPGDPFLDYQDPESVMITGAEHKS